MNVSLRPTTEADLAFVVALEGHPEVEPWITRWPAERHRQALDDKDAAHLTVIDGESPVGFVLMAGLTRPDRVVELGRLAVSRRGDGIGRTALAQAVDFGFDRCGALRVWLDVMPSNVRAKALYESMGFVFDHEIPDDRPSSPPGAILWVMSIRREDWPAPD